MCIVQRHRRLSAGSIRNRKDDYPPQRLSLAANRYAKGLTCGLHTLISHSVAEIVLSLTPRALLVRSGATGFHRRATNDISTLCIRGCGRGIYFQATKAGMEVGWGRRNRYGDVLVARGCTDARKRKAHDALESDVTQGTRGEVRERGAVEGQGKTNLCTLQ